MRNSDCKKLQTFEIVFANVANRCEFVHGMDRVGFLYQSAKDQCRYFNLSRKKYIHIIMAIGGYMALSPKEFAKTKVGNAEQTVDELSQMLISAFGDGKNNK